MKVRQCVLTILEDFDKGSAALETVIDRTFTSFMLDRRDRRLAFEITYGVMRFKLTLDYTLKHFLREKCFEQNDRLMDILRIGMYQIVYLDKIPDYAAVNESVQLAKMHKNTRHLSSVVNAVLRKIITQRKRLPKPSNTLALLDRLSITYSHPQWLIKRWLERFGLSNTKKLLAFNNRRPDIFFRRKVKGLSRQQFESDIRAICDISSSGGSYKNLYYRLKKTLMPDQVDLFREGYCTVQAESSGWVVALLDIQMGEKLLDVCSAPGGKMSLLSELSGAQGAVCAGDLQFSRMMKVQETIFRMQLTNVFSVVCDGAHLPFTGYFDKVLLDAPCSGTGVMHRHPEARWIRSERDIKQSVIVQRNLLDGVASFVVPGGILVYATCSLEPEENQLQVKAFLERHPEFIPERPFDPVKETFIDNEGYLHITPHAHSMDGMFAARMRKIED